MVLANFKSWVKQKYPLDVRNILKKSVDDDESTDTPENTDWIDGHISQKGNFDAKDLFKRRKKKS